MKNVLSSIFTILIFGIIGITLFITISIIGKIIFNVLMWGVIVLFIIFGIYSIFHKK